MKLLCYLSMRAAVFCESNWLGLPGESQAEKGSLGLIEIPNRPLNRLHVRTHVILIRVNVSAVPAVCLQNYLHRQVCHPPTKAVDLLPYVPYDHDRSKEKRPQNRSIGECHRISTLYVPTGPVICSIRNREDRFASRPGPCQLHLARMKGAEEGNLLSGSTIRNSLVFQKGRQKGDCRRTPVQVTPLVSLPAQRFICELRI
jgi:hypothetical protein